ncbi:MAG: hypothetical protein WKG32_06350 [Gemmatimonadaceae bacterium]
MRRRIIVTVILASLAGVGACQELDITNPNEPDRDRATQLPSGVEALVAGSFRSFWEWTHDDSPVWSLSTMADEFTSAFGDFGILFTSSEPRPVWNNSSFSGDAEANRDPWYGIYSVISGVNDALVAIDRGVKIGVNGQDTPRAEAVARFMQGIAYGYLALYFDKAFIVDETTPLDVAQLDARPYTEVMDSAISYLGQSITIATANTFTLPQTDFLHQSLTSQELARLAHSHTAFFLASVARTREERDAASWQRVAAEIDLGIQKDFAPVADEAKGFVDDFKRVAARSRTGFPGDFARADYMLVGPADSTNGFLNWLAKPVAERVVFQLVSKDRRIHPAGNPAGRGRYFGYTTSNRFDASRGTYHMSRYFFHRLGEGTDSWRIGPQLDMTTVEMDLLKAEALIRLGRSAEAVVLINKSRVANGSLPAVTIAGPPDEPGCVPRKLSGQCGSLWDALRYEKRIEMAGVNPVVAYVDARGWQALPTGTILHYPIPGRELETLDLPTYTFGGGGPSSAPAPAPERCPPAAASLPRCPAG